MMELSKKVLNIGYSGITSEQRAASHLEVDSFRRRLKSFGEYSFSGGRSQNTTETNVRGHQPTYTERLEEALIQKSNRLNIRRTLLSLMLGSRQKQVALSFTVFLLSHKYKDK
uniref:Uncharacterized protein n=1 Tax=Anopheles maculatus TaxID=74869 RepID=A0A182SEY8_9DIPT